MGFINHLRINRAIFVYCIFFTTNWASSSTSLQLRLRRPDGVTYVSVADSDATFRSDVLPYLVLEDWQGLGADYDRTLMSWFRNFQENWGSLAESYGERFYRMWKYELLSCAGSFRARKNQLWQIVLSPQGLQGGYRAPR